MKTFTVIGLGRFGTSVAMQLFNMGYEVLAIDKNMDKINAIANLVTRAACTDAKDESLLKQLGVKNSDCAIVCIGGDDITDSVLTTLALKDMGVKQVVCKAKDNMHKTVLKKVGADNVIIPEQEAGIKAAIELVSDRLFDIIELSDEYSIVDAVVPNTWIGKSIMELSVRKKYNVNIDNATYCRFEGIQRLKTTKRLLILEVVYFLFEIKDLKMIIIMMVTYLIIDLILYNVRRKKFIKELKAHI